MDSSQLESYAAFVAYLLAFMNTPARFKSGVVISNGHFPAKFGNADDKWAYFRTRSRRQQRIRIDLKVTVALTAPNEKPMQPL